MDHRRSCPAGHKQIGGLEEYAEIEHFFIAQETDDLPDLVTRENIDIVLMDIHLGKSSKNDGLMIACSLLKSMHALYQVSVRQATISLSLLLACTSQYKPWESLWGSSATTPLVDFHHRLTACPSYRKKADWL